MMKDENGYIVSQNDRQIKLRKFYVVLVGLVMIISGLLVSTMPVGAGYMPMSGGSRQPDYNNSSNDFDPVIEADLRPVMYKYPNDGSAWVNITVNVTDDDNDTREGAMIVNVVLGSADLPIPSTDMTYDAVASEAAGIYNVTDQEGIWYKNVPLPANAAGDYEINVTVTDNGTIPGPKSNYTMPLIPIRYYQVNRAPRIRIGAEGGVFTYTVEEDWYDFFYINETIFIDDDVEGQPYPYTDADTLNDFMIWSELGEWDQYGGWFENFTIAFNPTDLFMVVIAPNENKYTLPAGEQVNLSAIDGNGAKVEATITVKITPENDEPILIGINTYNETAAEISDDGFTITTTQGNFVNISVNASDVDITDTLTYALVDGSFNASTTALTDVPFDIDPASGALNFTPDNDAVGEFMVNISITDSVITTPIEANFTFVVVNANDPPAISTINAIAPTDHAIALTAKQDTAFTAQVIATDLDIERGLADEQLTFKADSTKLTITKIDNTTANYTFTPTNADVGELVVNITVEDTAADVVDYAVATITIADVNDPPMIEKIDTTSVPADKLHDLSATPLTETAPNATFTLTASDIDFNIPTGEKLTWAQKVASLDASTYVITPDATKDNKSADITIVGENLADGVHTFNFTVSDDGGLSDYVEVKVNRSFAPAFVNVAPALTLATGATTLKIDETITINGTVSDDTIPEGGALKVMIKIASGENVLLAETTVTPSTGAYTYDFKIPAKDTGGNSSVGTWTISVWATDGELESTKATATLTVKAKPKADDDGDDDKGMLGMGAMMDYVLIIIIIIIIVLILVMVMKKKKPEEAPAPEEGMVPMEAEAPAVEQQCTSCGAMIPAGAPTCPACGAPAPIPPMPEGIPPEGAPVEGGICATCGSPIPPGSPTCPACGAPAPPPPPPAEAPVPEMPAEAPPFEGMPAEAPPPEGMPAEAPPPEGMPPAEAPPPEGMPPAAPPPAEAPPPEGMPPAAPPPAAPEGAAPPPGMANCPQCGTQIAVGTTPCPSCGAALNW